MEKKYEIRCPNCQKPIDVVFRSKLDDFDLKGRNCWNCGVPYVKLFHYEGRHQHSVPARRPDPDAVRICINAIDSAAVQRALDAIRYGRSLESDLFWYSDIKMR